MCWCPGSPGPKGELGRQQFGTRTSHQQLPQQPSLQVGGTKAAHSTVAPVGGRQSPPKAIIKGVQAPLQSIPGPKKPRPLTRQEQDSMTTTIGEYLQEGAIRALTPRRKIKKPFFGHTFSQEPRRTAKKSDSSQT